MRNETHCKAKRRGKEACFLLVSRIFWFVPVFQDITMYQDIIDITVVLDKPKTLRTFS